MSRESTESMDILQMGGSNSGVVRQGCYLSSTHFSIFLERIMYEALDDHKGSVSMRGLFITNFCFANENVIKADEEEEANVLVDCLDTTTTKYKMETGS